MKFGNYTKLNAYVGTSILPPTPPPTIYTDDFEGYSAGNLAGNGLWLQEKNTLGIFTFVNNRVHPSYADEIAVYYNTTINENQWSQLTYYGGGGGIAIGPAVRCQGGTGYYYGWYSSTVASYVFRNDGATWTELGGGAYRGTAWTSGDIVKLEISGYTLSYYRNGSIDTSVGVSGVITDSDPEKLSGGYIGISGYANTTAVYGDTWSGGPL